MTCQCVGGDCVHVCLHSFIVVVGAPSNRCHSYCMCISQFRFMYLVYTDFRCELTQTAGVKVSWLHMQLYKYIYFREFQIVILCKFL